MGSQGVGPWSRLFPIDYLPRGALLLAFRPSISVTAAWLRLFCVQNSTHCPPPPRRHISSSHPTLGLPSESTSATAASTPLSSTMTCPSRPWRTVRCVRDSVFLKREVLVFAWSYVVWYVILFCLIYLWLVCWSYSFVSLGRLFSRRDDVYQANVYIYGVYFFGGGSLVGRIYRFVMIRTYVGLWCMVSCGRDIWRYDTCVVHSFPQVHCSVVVFREEGGCPYVL